MGYIYMTRQKAFPYGLRVVFGMNEPQSGAGWQPMVKPWDEQVTCGGEGTRAVDGGVVVWVLGLPREKALRPWRARPAAPLCPTALPWVVGLRRFAAGWPPGAVGLPCGFLPAASL